MNIPEHLVPYAISLGALFLIYFVGFLAMLFKITKKEDRIRKLQHTLRYTTQQYGFLQLDLHEARFMLFSDPASLAEVPFALRLQEELPNLYRVHERISDVLMRHQHNTE